MKVFVDGGAGTTGLEIRERLLGRADLDYVTLAEDRRKDPSARAEALNAADVVILCLPDDAAREAVALIENDRTRVIDASTAHRTAAGWLYGFPEITGREQIAAAKRVSNPGCYSTGFIALVAPLVRAGLIPADWPLTGNAVSGYTGGGKSMIADYEGEGGAPSAYRTYALGLTHKHVPEMQAHCGLGLAPLFVPAVVPLPRGMIVEVPLQAAAMPGAPSAARLREALADFYAGSPIVSVETHEGATLDIERLAGKDSMELFVFGRADDAQVRLVAVLDNLGKGASGAAVQSLNLMAGVRESEGLRL